MRKDILLAKKSPVSGRLLVLHTKQLSIAIAVPPQYVVYAFWSTSLMPFDLHHRASLFTTGSKEERQRGEKRRKRYLCQDSVMDTRKLNIFKILFYFLAEPVSLLLRWISKQPVA